MDSLNDQFSPIWGLVSKCARYDFYRKLGVSFALEVALPCAL